MDDILFLGRRKDFVNRWGPESMGGIDGVRLD